MIINSGIKYRGTIPNNYRAMTSFGKASKFLVTFLFIRASYGDGDRTVANQLGRNIHL